ERGRVAIEVVVADRERGLRVALIAQPSHAQRRRVRQIEGVFAQAHELVIAPSDEARAYSGRSAKEVEQQPRMTPKVADQREVVIVGARIGQRKVVVNAG